MYSLINIEKASRYILFMCEINALQKWGIVVPRFGTGIALDQTRQSKGWKQSMTMEVPKEKAIKKICAWCNEVMQDGTEPASHGICAQCGKKVMESYEKSSLRASSVRGVSKILPDALL